MLDVFVFMTRTQKNKQTVNVTGTFYTICDVDGDPLN